MPVYSLRRLLTLQQLLAILVPFIVVLFLGSFWVVPQIMEEVESQQVQLGRAIGSQVERYLEASTTVIRADAAIELGKDIPLHVYQGMLDAQLTATESLGSLYAVATDGHILAVGLDRHNQARRQDILSLDLSGNQFFLDVKKHGKPRWSPVFLSIIHGGLSAAFATLGNGMVVIGEVDLQRLKEFLKNISLESDLHILIVDNNGQVIADQDGRYTAQQLNIGNIPLVRRSLAGDTVTNGQFDFEGKRMIGSVLRVGSVAWHVLVAQPIGSLYRSRLNSALIVMAAFLLAIFFSAAVSIKLAYKLASRFDELISHSQDITAGIKGNEWPSSNIAEFNKMSDSLRSMAEMLQKQAAGLRESEQYYHDLFDQANEGLFMMTPDGQLSDVNQAFAKMHGFMVDELKRTDIRKLDVLKDRSLEDRADIVCRIQAGEVARFEVEHYHKDGHIFPLSVTTSMIQLGGQTYYLAFHQDITDRKCAETALKESEEKYRSIFENVQDVYFETSMDGTILELSPSIEMLTKGQFDRKELIGQSMYDFYVSYDERQAVIAILLERGVVTDYEINLKNRDGSIVPCSVSARMQLTPQGTPLKIIGSMRDVTERKQAEEARQSSEAHYRALVENIPDVIASFDQNCRYQFINSAISKINKTKPEDFIGKVLGEVEGFTGEQIAFRKQVIDDVFKTRTPSETEFEFRGPNGILAFEWRVYPVLDAEENVLSVLSINRNITERKLAEEETRKLLLMLESVPNGIVVHDTDGNILYANQRICDMHGYSGNEFLSLNLRQITKPASAKLIDARIQEMSARGEISFEVEHIKKDGTILPLWVNVKKAIWGGKSAFLSVETDITERKQAEEEKAKLQNQMLQSQKIEAIGQLAGGVAHDFNNMLGVILGHTELALDSVKQSDPLNTHLAEIRKAAQRSSELTSQLLTFARKQTMTPKVLDLNDTIDGMLKMLRRLIGEDIDLNWLPDSALWLVKADPSQIDQILANMCVNARDAIQGVGKITIETGNISFDQDYRTDHAGFVPGDYVQLCVSDDGCGMNKEILDRIFEPFFTTKDVGKGTGLGLATVYGIVKQNDGYIDVYSEPDQGTTFKIYLPRYTGQTEPASTEIMREPELRGQETILLVEDEPSLLELNMLILESQGYRVLAAGAPGEAIRLAEEHTGKIHLLMTDVVMPEMNGRDLAKNLLALNPQLKCLFTSGYTANVIAHHGVLDEGVFFIQKPFSRKDLAAKVREVLDQK